MMLPDETKLSLESLGLYIHQQLFLQPIIIHSYLQNLVEILVTTKKCERKKFKLIFILIQLSKMHCVRRVKEYGADFLVNLFFRVSILSTFIR